jgi:hypothetical protein
MSNALRVVVWVLVAGACVAAAVPRAGAQARPEVAATPRVALPAAQVRPVVRESALARFPGREARLAQLRALGVEPGPSGLGAPVRLDLRQPVSGPHRLWLVAPSEVLVDDAGWSAARIGYSSRAPRASEPQRQVQLRIALPRGRRALLDCAMEQASRAQFAPVGGTATEVAVRDGIATHLLVGHDDGSEQRLALRALLDMAPGTPAAGTWTFSGCEVVPVGG